MFRSWSFEPDFFEPVFFSNRSFLEFSFRSLWGFRNLSCPHNHPAEAMPAMSFCRAHWAFLIVVILLGSSQMLASCGQKGDLFLPERTPQPSEEAVQP